MVTYDNKLEKNKTIPLAQYLIPKLEESGQLYFLNMLDGSNKNILSSGCGRYFDDLSKEFYTFFLWFNNIYNYYDWTPQELLQKYYSKTCDEKMELVKEYLIKECSWR